MHRGPTLPQAFALALTAIGLLVTTCFGALGIGPMTGSGDTGLATVLAIAIAAAFAAGLAAAIVTGILAIVRGVREGPFSVAETTPRRTPSFNQAFLIVLAAAVLFLSTCAGVLANRPSLSRGAEFSLLAALLLIVSTIGAVAGYAVMWRRAYGTELKKRTIDDNAPPPPGA